MREKKWVQHISGQGEKWEVPDTVYNLRESYPDWIVEKAGHMYFLPKSEYIPCPLPERWVDVTEECEWHDQTHDFKPYLEHVESGLHREVACTIEARGYRLRKVQLRMHDEGANYNGGHGVLQWAFIIEQKEPS